MEIVVNEWLLDYLRLDSDNLQIKKAMLFINILEKKCDKIVIRRPSPFVSKFYAYMKQFQNDLDFKRRFKKLNELLFRNSNKTIIVDDQDIKPLPDKIKDKIPNDDLYLIELAYFSTDKTIITVDEPLKDKLKDEKDLKIYLLDDFMKNYST